MYCLAKRGTPLIRANSLTLTISILLVALIGCRSDAASNSAGDMVPVALLSLAESALRAAAEIKISGKQDSVLLSHPLSPGFRDAMQPQFDLMQRLHSVAVESRIRYPRYQIELTPERYCGDSVSAALLVSAITRLEMESVDSLEGTPPYTAYGEEHVFRFRRVRDAWMMTAHHEITLPEMHDREAVKKLRSICQ